MRFTDRHDMTLAVKVVLNQPFFKTTNRIIFWHEENLKIAKSFGPRQYAQAETGWYSSQVEG